MKAIKPTKNFLQHYVFRERDGENRQRKATPIECLGKNLTYSVSARNQLSCGSF